VQDKPEETFHVAVLVPCYNEEASVAKVVADFRSNLPLAEVYVYDNGSTDRTVDVANDAGATVRTEPRRGKGNVVRRMLADIDADIYVVVDGDDTYDASAVVAMISKLRADQLDMVTAIRSTQPDTIAYRRGHAWGNRAFTLLLRRLFGPGASDVFSGYRVLSRRFAKSFPASATGFEIEAEMTAHALDLGMPVGEVVCEYSERGDGSESKLRTYRDGFRILARSFLYFKELHPFRFFVAIAGVLTIGSLALGVPVVVEYARTSQVLRLPSAVLSVGMALTAAIALACAIILDSIARGRRESKRIEYLRHQPVRPPSAGHGVKAAETTGIALAAISDRSLTAGNEQRASPVSAS
jgi:glycosyltransferase involved in cell wall biosynthesis